MWKLHEADMTSIGYVLHRGWCFSIALGAWIAKISVETGDSEVSEWYKDSYRMVKVEDMDDVLLGIAEYVQFRIKQEAKVNGNKLSESRLNQFNQFEYTAISAFENQHIYLLSIQGDDYFDLIEQMVEFHQKNR